MSTVVSVDRLRPYPYTAFGAVTAAIWVTRVPLAWATTHGGLGAKVTAMIPVVAFGVPAALVLWRCVAAGSGTDQGTRTLVRLLAAWTVLYWTARMALILLHDHPAPFVVVHGVLAAASVASGIWAWRWADGHGHGRCAERPVARSASA